MKRRPRLGSREAIKLQAHWERLQHTPANRVCAAAGSLDQALAMWRVRRDRRKAEQSKHFPAPRWIECKVARYRLTLPR